MQYLNVTPVATPQHSARAVAGIQRYGPTLIDRAFALTLRVLIVAIAFAGAALYLVVTQ